MSSEGGLGCWQSGLTVATQASITPAGFGSQTVPGRQGSGPAPPYPCQVAQFSAGET